MGKNGEKIISKKQLLKNLEEIKKLANGKKICVMIKANAYGHGLSEIAGMLRGRVDFFGVANVNEALEARKVCKSSKILIVGKTFDFETCEKNNISFVIESFSQFSKLVEYVKDKNVKNCINIHIKMNSGMNRLGINSVKEFKEIYKLCEKFGICVEGILTHFATADCDSNFYEKQKTFFKKFLNEIPKREMPIVHVGGSATLLQNNDFDFDMIRVGIAIYGYLKKCNVKGILQIKSHLIKVFEVRKGDRIGYANGFVAKEDMKIGIVPLGYADGISRNLSNKAEVVVNGKKCKIVGYVCMDMFFVDLSGKEAKEGDEVIVFNDAKKYARILGISPYEVLTRFSLTR